MLHYFRTTPDGRIAFGCGGGRIAFNAGLHGRVELDREVVDRRPPSACAPTSPASRGGEITHAWGGPIDVSPTHLPLVMPLRGGRAFVAAGYTGNGVGPSNMVGRTLASLALDRRDEHSRLAFVDPSPQRVPPEPFHWIGGSLIRRGIMSKENAEADGHRPDPVAAAAGQGPRADRLPHRPRPATGRKRDRGVSLAGGVPSSQAAPSGGPCVGTISQSAEAQLASPSPATRDDLLAGVEVDGVGAVGVEVAVHRVLPAGEGEPGDRGGDADVDAEHPGLGAVAVAAGGLAR